MELMLTPGALVRHPQQPDWGLGQVQSAIGHRVTVNFEHQGKVVLDSRHVRLELVRSAEDQADP
jgi:Protein of unknown function (DUF3553)